MRAKAARALIRYTHSAINDLKGDEDEMLRGALPCYPSICLHYIDHLMQWQLPAKSLQQGGNASLQSMLHKPAYLRQVATRGVVDCRRRLEHGGKVRRHQ
jgi:hypothetical protein